MSNVKKKYVEQSSWTGSSPDVTHRLYVIMVLIVVLIGAFGCFLLAQKGSDISTYNLAKAAEALYKRSTKIPAKYIHHNDPEYIQARLLEIFQCNKMECGTIHKMGLDGFVRNCINYELDKLLKAVNNATAYLELLR